MMPACRVRTEVYSTRVKTTVPENGEVKLPELVRQQLELKPGQTLIWEQLTPTEYRLRVEQPCEAEPIQPDFSAALGFAKKHGLAEGTTEEWMRLIRPHYFEDEE